METSNFIRSRIDEDLKNHKNSGRVATRFPPEPNGYLHIGHAKSICLNFGIARDYAGTCNLRLDDTNPVKEDVEYADAIQEDVRWLGFEWSELAYASDYFQKLYDYALELIRLGKAYVCSLTNEQIRTTRGTLSEPGQESPYRKRSVEENLELFQQMRAGVYADGTHVLRARIDMASPNLNLRDPVIYRIRQTAHHRTGDAWNIYPMYDYAHCISDMIEGITHSICTLEFEDHRPLYDWFLDVLKTPCHPQQIEFARLNIDYTVLSKRRLLQLVEEKHVEGWDDPRLMTLRGLRRRGYSPESIRNFCERVGVTKKDSCIEMGFLEMCVREDLDLNSLRVMSVLYPLKVVIENYPASDAGTAEVEEVEVANHPARPELGTRKVPFSKEIYIEQEDFMENPSAGFFRLAPGREVRLRGAYFIQCVGVHRDPSTGKILELRCTYDPSTRGGSAADGRKVKGTLHWVSVAHSLPAEVRLYDRLFQAQFPGAAEQDFLSQLNPHSLTILTESRVEPSLKSALPGDRYQFERQGYFCLDSVLSGNSSPMRLVFNRTVTLKDSLKNVGKNSEAKQTKS
jgi:glutaminyl-tRNA synthetase